MLTVRRKARLVPEPGRRRGRGNTTVVWSMPFGSAAGRQVTAVSFDLWTTKSRGSEDLYAPSTSGPRARGSSSRGVICDVRRLCRQPSPPHRHERDAAHRRLRDLLGAAALHL